MHSQAPSNTDHNAEQENRKSNFIEKRKFVRISVNINVAFSLKGSTKRYQAKCRNISGSGLLLEMTKKLSVGNHIIVTFPEDTVSFENYEAHMKVIRTNQIAGQLKYQVGGMISKINW